MAKRKSRSSSKKKMPIYLIELYGFALVLIAILGICKYGDVGKFIASLSIFLVGILYDVLLLIVLGIGIYIIVCGKNVDLLLQR